MNSRFFHYIFQNKIIDDFGNGWYYKRKRILSNNDEL